MDFPSEILKDRQTVQYFTSITTSQLGFNSQTSQKSKNLSNSNQPNITY